MPGVNLSLPAITWDAYQLNSPLGPSLAVEHLPRMSEVLPLTPAMQKEVNKPPPTPTQSHGEAEQIKQNQTLRKTHIWALRIHLGGKLVG